MTLMLMLMLFSAINLTKNSQFYVRQGDVERLIAQGFLQRLS
jgi:GINS complex subunit 1